MHIAMIRIMLQQQFTTQESTDGGTDIKTAMKCNFVLSLLQIFSYFSLQEMKWHASPKSTSTVHKGTQLPI